MQALPVDKSMMCEDFVNDSCDCSICMHTLGTWPGRPVVNAMFHMLIICIADKPHVSSKPLSKHFAYRLQSLQAA